MASVTRKDSGGKSTTGAWRKIREFLRSDTFFNFVIGTLCLLIFIIIAYPLWFVVIASVSNADLVAQGRVILFPRGFSLFAYQKVLEDARVWIGYRNTIFYSTVGTIVNLLLTLPAAYALSRKELPFRRVVMFFFIFTMYFNGGLIPTYLRVQSLHLDNTPWVFIIPFSVSVFNLIVTRAYFESSIPNELYEAATIDGCSHFRYFLKVVLPLAKPVIAVIGLYYFVGHWNDFFTGLVYVRDKNLVPLQLVLRDILISNQVFKEGVGLGGAAGGYAQRYADSIKYALIIVSSLPVLVLYPFLQKYFEKGVMLGAVKG